MTSNSFARHQFPPDVIRHATRLYLRFTLSLRDVEEMLGERGPDLTGTVTGTESERQFLRLPFHRVRPSSIP